jgi:hypothetical protein
MLATTVDLAQLLQATNRLAEAEPLVRRALAITEASYGPDHPKVAICLNNLRRFVCPCKAKLDLCSLMARHGDDCVDF